MPTKQQNFTVSPNQPAKRNKPRISDNAMRRALARRKIEERREQELLRQQIRDVFDEI